MMVDFRPSATLANCAYSITTLLFDPKIEKPYEHKRTAKATTTPPVTTKKV